jgi:nucleoside-diphosphate-sugar epimerase
MTDKKVLLIGGGGFIGTWLGTRFLTAGWEVTVLDDFRNQGLDHYEDCLIKVVDCELPKKRIITTSLLDPMQTDNALAMQPDVVVYLAGASTVEDAAGGPDAFQESNMTLMNALASCEIHCDKSPHFVYISSSMVYGDFMAEPAHEGHRLNPVNMYGVMKVAGEKLVGISGLPHTIIRPTAVYGAYDSHDRVIKIFCENALLGKTLEVRGRGRLDFTHVSDTAEGIFLAATQHLDAIRNGNRKNKIYNISAGNAISILEAAQTIASCSEREALVAYYEDEINLDEINLDRPRRGELDISRARQELGYNPRAVFKDEVDRYMNKHLAPKWERAITQDPKYYVYEKETRKSA